MPQMSPMNWIFLFLFFLTSLCLYGLNIFFTNSFLVNMKLTIKNKLNITKPLKW